MRASTKQEVEQKEDHVLLRISKNFEENNGTEAES